jgi:hypothetical protein
MVDRATERDFLFDGHKTQFLFHGRKRSGNTGRSGPDDDDVIGLLAAFEFCNGIDRLPTLLHGLADQPHATQLTRDKYSRNIGFEIRFDLRYVHAALCGSEDKLNGVMRAGGLAGTVTDAGCRIHKLSLAADDTDGLLRARGYTSL